MANHNVQKQLTVRLESHEYPIYIGQGYLNDIQILNRYVGNQVFIVTNEIIAPLFLSRVQAAFINRQCNSYILPDGEAHKNATHLFKIFDQLILHNHHRDTTLIALGGGVIGDITGFAAATYHRGVRFIQIPTTLLAQVDASVGGKTAINYASAKNMLGSFYQPHAVIIDPEVLKTLPKREFRAGLGEVIKYALLVGGDFLEKLPSRIDNLSLNQLNPWIDLIAECCKIKADFVQEDEREMGKRTLLNLGHTFAHALEAYTNFERWLHGEAVAIGLYCAALLSYFLGHLTQLDMVRVDSLLKLAELPRRIPNDINVQQLIEYMLKDKKIKQGKLTFVLLKNIGHGYIDSQIDMNFLIKTLEEAKI